MPVRRALLRVGAACLALAALAGCADAPPDSPAPQDPAPQAGPPDAPPGPSARSRALAAHYQRVQADMRARGLLRTDGGGPDTPLTDTMLLRNFEAIVFFDEYETGGGLRRARNTPVGLRKWERPVRMAVEFGPSVASRQRAEDRQTVRSYAARLARVTGHPISADAPEAANFHVLIMGEDDRGEALARIRALVPNVGRPALRTVRNLPREIHCLVLAFSRSDNSTYDRAIALVRAEHPPLMRRACVHEELAQGLGLANDSPDARPSIFNDDEEFALLTRHDEILLQLLYHPALKPGMMPAQARPVLKRLISGPGAEIF